MNNTENQTQIQPEEGNGLPKMIALYLITISKIAVVFFLGAGFTYLALKWFGNHAYLVALFGFLSMLVGIYMEFRVNLTTINEEDSENNVN